MKKRNFFVLFAMLFMFFSKGLMAQLPDVSSSSIPKWYFIQVTGSGDRAGRLFTAEEGIVSGRPFDQNLLDQQLWRFEKTAGNYVIINKATTQKLDITHDTQRAINHAVLNDSPSSAFKLEEMSNGAGYNITATTPPSSKTNSIYAHQAHTGGNRDYVVMFETSTWKSGSNSAFNFIVYEEAVNGPAPVSSSAETPLWYYIQVKGESDRADLVYTVEDDKVYGRAISTADDLGEMDKQLWRFENNGTSYVIINKATGKKLDLSHDTNKNITVGITSDSPSTNWLLQESSTASYFNIVATTPLEGRSGTIYSHQANNYASRNYVIMFESSSYKSSVHSLFRFVYCEYPVPQVSTGSKEIWYVIASGKPGLTDRCITDVTGQNLTDVKFSMDEIVAGNYAQQWKIVNVNETEVQFVNRATGNIMQKEAVYNRYYYTQPAPYSSDASGWVISYAGERQYEMSGYNADGIQVYMNATSDEKETDIYLQGNAKNTGFAWTFKKPQGMSLNLAPQQIMTTETTGLDNEIVTGIRIGVSDRRIIVIGADDYTIRNISGIVMNNGTELPVGIYLVTVNGKTTKILVK